MSHREILQKFSISFDNTKRNIRILLKLKIMRLIYKYSNKKKKLISTVPVGLKCGTHIYPHNTISNGDHTILIYVKLFDLLLRKGKVIIHLLLKYNKFIY
jgi:hypothetical protein